MENGTYMKNHNEIKPVRTAISGCGGVTRDMLEIIRDYPELDIVAVHDINPDAAAAIAEQFRISQHLTDFNDLLQTDIELLVINTPNHLHHPQTLHALRERKHCLVQKPIATNSTDAREMIQAAKKARKLLGVVMEELGSVFYRQMQNMVQTGCIGDVVAVESMVAHSEYLRNPPPKGNWRTQPDSIGGGSFIQLAIHHLNLSQWMLNDEIVEVGGKSVSAHNKRTFPEDETTVAWARFKNGAIGSFISSYACDADLLFLYGTGGYIGHRRNIFSWKINKPYQGEVWSCDKAPLPGHAVFDSYNSRPTRIRPQYEQHRRFALAIRGQAQVEVPGDLGLRDLRIIEAVYKSAKEGVSVLL